MNEFNNRIYFNRKSEFHDKNVQNYHQMQTELKRYLIDLTNKYQLNNSVDIIDLLYHASDNILAWIMTEYIYDKKDLKNTHEFLQERLELTEKRFNVLVEGILKKT